MHFNFDMGFRNRVCPVQSGDALVYGAYICIRICISTSRPIVTPALALLDWLGQYSYGSPVIAPSALFIFTIRS